MLTKPADVIKKVTKEKLQQKNTISIFYLDINKNIINSHKKEYLENFELSISKIFIPAFYLNAKFIVIANVMPNKRIMNHKSRIELVKKIFKTGCYLNITLLDYLLINKTSYYSFHESNII